MISNIFLLKKKFLSPSKVISPLSCLNNPDIISTKVVFPDPDLPSKQTFSPFLMFKFKSTKMFSFSL